MTRRARESTGPFRHRTVVLGIAATLIAGLLFFVLSSYAPKAAQNIGVTATPASDSAVGYSGFVRLLEVAGPRTTELTRSGELTRKGLLIVFVDPTDSPESLAQIVAAREYEPTLFVLPKWLVQPQSLIGARVASVGTIAVEALERMLEVLTPGTLTRRSDLGSAMFAGVRVRLPRQLQTAASDDLAVPGYPDGLLLKAPDGPVFVLTDPDLINNAGIDDIANARAAFALIEELRYTGDPLLIATPRLTEPSGRNLGKLLFDPPFLPLTVILLFTGLLALLHGFARFGPVMQRGRVFAFGKRALVETTADLLERAGKLPGLGPRYAETMRRRAAERLGAPPALGGERLEAWLDMRANCGGDAGGITERLRALDQGNDIDSPQELHRRARALASWIKERT